MADFLTDAELAFALQEEEVTELNNPTVQQSGPFPPTSHRVEVPDDLGEMGLVKECQICSEERHTDLYPQTTSESNCRCLADVCLVCMQQHIRSQTESKEWNEGSLTCPMCNRPLVPHEVEDYADSDTFKTHVSRMIDQAVKDMPNFTRCPNPGCDSGQVHEGGDAHPLVTCAACSAQFCFRHGIPTHPRPEQPPSQHDNMSCDEYDRYLADPMDFRSEHQRQQERAAVERREEEAVARARERMDKILERRREAAAAAAAAAEESKSRRDEREERQDAARQARARTRREREERQRQEFRERRERQEREEREERARLEARRYEEERERAEQERKARAEEMLRRKVEDEDSEKLIEVSTKGCPGCGKRIEKNEGCMHMTCPCGCEFCWVCTGPWSENSCARCFGGPVVQFG